MKKTTIGLISKTATLHVQHTFQCTFVCRCFARLQRETCILFVFLILFLLHPIDNTLVVQYHLVQG